MKVGNKIRKIREFKNYTQEYMAIELDMSLSNYSKLERDEIPLTIERLERIARILDINFIDILSLDDSNVFNFINSPNSNGFGYVHTYNSNNRIYEIEKRLNVIETILRDHLST